MNLKKIFITSVKKLLLNSISLYQLLLSPFLGRNCRFYPTCSAYAKEAIVKKGIFKGVFLSLWRILRCHPYSKGGFDPVK
ncbi:MAG: membrane protein insertion efficiency factor YidD [Flexistipes sinusarabici]|uniref:Putative membrane protein insertion efficiency factor n=1 Tax=Flexistipes sinusarabici TaxID=2352 RepID=A0A5D0MU75_FLESI|nr:membrane protein insertion efficiency factor YidD [Flexistipes sinusarabici]TYB35642.1 MAG: membrane protein insertion efficiency factor YidD [Flexistipes sinusarabici]